MSKRETSSPNSGLWLHEPIHSLDCSRQVSGPLDLPPRCLTGGCTRQGPTSVPCSDFARPGVPSLAAGCLLSLTAPSTSPQVLILKPK